MTKKTVTLTLRSLWIEDYDGFPRLQHYTSQLHLPCTQCKAIKKEEKKNRTRRMSDSDCLIIPNTKITLFTFAQLPVSCRFHLAFVL